MSKNDWLKYIGMKGAIGSGAFDTSNFSAAMTNEDKLKSYISEYESRPKFNYDINADALYQQYKDSYIQQGKMAMQDAIGQASAMTGGYGNSYAQSVGQQAYNQHLNQLNNIIPDLYQLAYDQYNQEGQNILNKASLMSDMIAQEYSRERAKVADEQWAKEYDLNDRRLKMEEAAWDLEEQAYYDALGIVNPNASTASSTASSATSNVNAETDYNVAVANFNSDTFKSNKEANGGSYYSTVLQDLREMKGKGTSNEAAMKYLRSLLSSSYIDESEYKSLAEKYLKGKLS